MKLITGLLFLLVPGLVMAKGVSLELNAVPLAYFHERRSPNNIHRDRVITFEQIAE